MSQTQREKIINKAREILEKYPNGIRYTELTRLIKVDLFDIPENTIQSNIWNLDEKVNEISKPERGILFLTKYLSPERQTELLRSKTPTEILKRDAGIVQKARVPLEQS